MKHSGVTHEVALMSDGDIMVCCVDVDRRRGGWVVLNSSRTTCVSEIFQPVMSVRPSRTPRPLSPVSLSLLSTLIVRRVNWPQS